MRGGKKAERGGGDMRGERYRGEMERGYEGREIHREGWRGYEGREVERGEGKGSRGG